MNKRVGELILKTCLGYHEGDSVAVITDTTLEPLARSFLEGADSIGADATLVTMPPRLNHGVEPPPAVAQAMCSSTIAILLTSKSLTHTRARIEASKRGVRIASMPDPDPDRLEFLLDIDYDELRHREEQIAGFLEGAKQVRLRSAAGTDLQFEISGRTIYRDCGNLSEPGAFGNLPAGEVCLAPLEGTGNGVVVVDGSMGGFGLITTPVTLTFKDGRAVEVSDPELRDLLQSHGPDAFCLAELGIGTNPRATVIGNVLEDEKAIGTAHIAVGANASMGGKTQVPVHIDLILQNAEIDIDDPPPPRKFLTPPNEDDQPASPVPKDIAGSETYRLLFAHANDAQYILDIESQVFLDVNPAFERMTGYEREDLISGSIRAPEIVARESLSTYMQKRETRRIAPSDRYDLRLVCKGGERKPVEISVQRIQFQGRTVIVGSMRDLTARKKLEQEMWEKIEEIGYANSRIFALTEKIRSVPELTPQLLGITNEQELLGKAAELLCAREGLGYESVSFYLVQDDDLVLRHTTQAEKPKQTISRKSDHRLIQVLKGTKPGIISPQEAILPLKGRDQNIGIIEVHLHPKEIELLEGNERALKGYLDLFETLANLTGLLVENLRLYETVRLQSIIDQLTGVYNRRYLDSKLEDELHRAQRYRRPLSLMMVDIDNFKTINDSMGHKQGDAVLANIAHVFQGHTREVDCVCRYGGDEFAILLPETPLEGARTKGEALREEMQTHEFLNLTDPDRPVRLTLSIGVTTFSEGMAGSHDFLRAADEALYQAKRGGRNAVWCAIVDKEGIRYEKSQHKGDAVAAETPNPKSQ